MDVLHRLLPSFLAGCTAGALAAAALIALNVGDLRVLLDEDSEGWLGGALLTFGLAATFGSAAFATAVWSDATGSD